MQQVAVFVLLKIEDSPVQTVEKEVVLYKFLTRLYTRGYQNNRTEITSAKVFFWLSVTNQTIMAYISSIQVLWM